MSIAFLAHGQRRIRVIHDPSLDELFWMVRGGGAFCDERRIAVSSCRRLDQVLLCIGYVPRHSLREHLRVKQHLHEAGAAVKDIFDALTGLVQASQDASGERSSAQ